SPSESVPPPNNTWMEKRADVPSLIACTTILPVRTAVIRPSGVMVAIRGLLTVYWVPVLAAVTSAAVPSGNNPVAFICVLDPALVSVVIEVFKVRRTGIGVVAQRAMSGMAFMRLALI